MTPLFENTFSNSMNLQEWNRFKLASVRADLRSRGEIPESSPDRPEWRYFCFIKTEAKVLNV